MFNVIQSETFKYKDDPYDYQAVGVLFPETNKKVIVPGLIDDMISVRNHCTLELKLVMYEFYVVCLIKFF